MTSHGEELAMVQNWPRCYIYPNGIEQAMVPQIPKQYSTSYGATYTQMVQNWSYIHKWHCNVHVSERQCDNEILDTHTHTHTHTHTYIYTHTHTHIYICTYVIPYNMCRTMGLSVNEISIIFIFILVHFIDYL